MATKRVRRTRKEKGGHGWWVILLLMALIAGLWYAFLYKSDETQSIPDPEPVLTGTDADYREVAGGIYLRLQKALAKQDAKAAWEDPVPKEVERKATGGKVLWTAVNMTVRPTSELDLAKAVQAATPKKGRLILGDAVADTWQGTSVNRYEVNLEIQPDAVPLQMTVAHLYVYPPEKKKADMKAENKGESQATAMTTEKKEPSERKPDVHRSTPAPKPVAGGSGKLAIVIDDCGADLGPEEIYLSTGRRFTFAVMPYLAHTTEAAQRAADAGQQVILHLPMEPMSGQGMEPTAITTSMDDATIRATVAKAIFNVPHLSGVNNHQGSRATSDERVMRAVLGELHRHGLFFLDSYTISSSVAEQTARAMGIPTGRNEIFLDNSSDEEAIREQVRKAIRIAQRDGYCIAIGHCRPHTAAAIRSMVGEIEANGVELVWVSQLLR